MAEDGAAALVEWGTALIVTNTISAPITIRAAPGTVVNVGAYLAQNFSGGVYAGYWFSNSDAANPSMGFWDDIRKAGYFTLNGVKKAPGQFWVAAADLAKVKIVAGAEVNPELFFLAQTADGPGASVTSTWFSINIVPTAYRDPSPGVATAAEIVRVAKLFGDAYSGTHTPNGCHDIAATIAAAAGAPLPYMSADHEHPSRNLNGGLWTVVHRGDVAPTPNWKTKLKPGDIIRFDYSDPSQPQHTLVVISVSGRNIETVDNATGAAGVIRHHTWSPEADPTSVTIYRITSSKHLLDGSSNNDTLYGSIYNDHVRGLAGNDRLFGGRGSDLVDGGAGNDIVSGGAGADRLIGGSGADEASYASSTVGVSINLLLTRAQAGAGDGKGDVLSGIEHVTGSNRNDVLLGTGAANRIQGLAGNDLIDGKAGADTMAGGLGNDRYYVDRAGDVIRELGAQGTDTVYTAASYTLASGVAVEVLRAAVPTGTLALNLAGNELANTIIGNNGANVLTGNGGNDQLLSGGGADVLSGGPGADRLTGGAGRDAFVFDAARGTAVDTIADFVVADDTIRLDAAGFAGLPTGTLAAGALGVGASAADADDRLIYDPATGALYFDPDGGDVAMPQTQFAQLAAGLALTNADFIVI
jgi:Ca2+-binding RTX toxin-like protein